MKAIKGNYQYKESGLDNVYLMNGYEYAKGQGGSRAVIIHDIDKLHEAIGRFLVKERKELAGDEIRFLRHELGMSQDTLARLLDVTEQTVRRWEQGKLPIPRAADAILRKVYAEKIGGNEKISEILHRIAALEDAIDRAMILEEDNDEWKSVEEAEAA
jgi:putative transcriptional regulator